MMNTINLIGENRGTSNVTLALSLVRAICNKKDEFMVQIDSPGGKPPLASSVTQAPRCNLLLNTSK